MLRAVGFGVEGPRPGSLDVGCEAVQRPCLCTCRSLEAPPLAAAGRVDTSGLSDGGAPWDDRS